MTSNEVFTAAFLLLLLYICLRPFCPQQMKYVWDLANIVFAHCNTNGKFSLRVLRYGLFSSITFYVYERVEIENGYLKTFLVLRNLLYSFQMNTLLHFVKKHLCVYSLEDILGSIKAHIISVRDFEAEKLFKKCTNYTPSQNTHPCSIVISI